MLRCRLHQPVCRLIHPGLCLPGVATAQLDVHRKLVAWTYTIRYLQLHNLAADFHFNQRPRGRAFGAAHQHLLRARHRRCLRPAPQLHLHRELVTRGHPGRDLELHHLVADRHLDQRAGAGALGAHHRYELQRHPPAEGSFVVPRHTRGISPSGASATQNRGGITGEVLVKQYRSSMSVGDQKSIAR